MDNFFKRIHELAMLGSNIFLVICIYAAIFNLKINGFASDIAVLGALLLLWLITSKIFYLSMKKLNMKNKLYSFLRKNNTFQRKQGLIIFNLFLAHSIYYILLSLNNFNILLIQVSSVIIPIIILIYMEITSINSIQRKFPIWKKSHSVAWLILPLLLVHLIIVGESPLKIIVATIILIISATIEFFIVEKKSGSKHLILILISLITVFLEYSLIFK